VAHLIAGECARQTVKHWTDDTEGAFVRRARYDIDQRHHGWAALALLRNGDDSHAFALFSGDRVNAGFFAVVAAISMVGGARAQAPPAPQALLQQYKCYVCHADVETKAGPAYIDVAAKYRGNANAVAILSASIRNGIRGNSPWHMPPHPEVSGADARIMARYILSLKE
jgi:cytochrome c